MKKLSLLLAGLLLATFAGITPAWATGLILTFPSSAAGFTQGTWQSVATVTGVTPALSGGSGTVRATVSAGTNGRLRLATTTNITAAESFTLTNFDAVSNGLATISFTGAVSDVSAALGSLEFRRITDNGTNTITAAVSEGTGLVFGNSYYEVYTSSQITWEAALRLAASKRVESSQAGVYCQGYLAVITTPEENEFAFTRANADAWIGGSDAYQYINAATGATTRADQTAAEGDWFWVTGPERGTQFSENNFVSGVSAPAAVSGRYNNWNGSEPNNASSAEHALQFTSSTSGGWNDLPLSSTSVSKVIVEYGGLVTTNSFQSNEANVTYTDLAEMGDVATCIPAAVAGAQSASFSAVSAAVPSAPTSVAGTAGESQASLSWTAGANGGSAITGYKIEINDGSGWTTKVANTGTTATTATITGLTPLASYTFRVSAINIVGTSSASTASSAVTILASVPSAPQNLSIRYPSALGATISWDAPSSNGGAAITDYVVEYEVGGSWISVTESGTTATISGVTVNQLWSFRVAATNAAGTGAFATLTNTPPAPYVGPVVTNLSLFELPTDSQQQITVEGLRLNTVTSASVDGKSITIIQKSETQLVVLVPGLTEGIKNLLIVSSSGNLTHQDAFKVVAQKPEPAPVPTEPKLVNAGSFKGYVALYAKGYEGKRLSAKVGNDWVIVPEIVNNEENGNLFRVVEFTGARIPITVRIFIDRELVATIPLVTK